MSNINTNSLNTMYPVPGTNNNSQGFRDNFNTIKQGLDIAGTEISELQSKAIVKSGISGIALNNDMANTVISNAQTRGFRASMYDLGSNLSGNVNIDVSRGDVQYGVVTGNTTISFSNWMPTNTRGGVQLKLTLDPTKTDAQKANIVFTLPPTTVDYAGSITAGMTKTALLLENYSSNGYPHITGSTFQYTNKVSAPAGVAELNLNVFSDDCGTTLNIVPVDRNQKASQIPVRVPTSIGLPGDKIGQICTYANTAYDPPRYYLGVCVADYDGTTAIWGKIRLQSLTDVDPY